ncbi:hypothetical protein FNV43_RR16024 [Rhamnella rubrinervis]|uniref:Prolamin-like domain-containing protein n=1 Tax=Rhamnella rubrinervis TaxID=2594499 RepID=A0A8K0GXR4_9ROSA|nr:hypothetical protein FNV43_RR16024 [Rhamnella rubrinervis]
MGVMVLPGLAIFQAPAPAPTNYKFLEDCATKIGACGSEIYTSVFEHGSVSDKCCTKLVFTGKSCHDQLVKYLLSKPGFGGNESETLAKSEDIWDHCVSLSPACSPSF